MGWYRPNTRKNIGAKIERSRIGSDSLAADMNREALSHVGDRLPETSYNEWKKNELAAQERRAKYASEKRGSRA